MLVVLLLSLSLAGQVGAWDWPWAASEPEKFYMETNCTWDSKLHYFSRLDAWACFLKMGDGRVPALSGPADGILDEAEIDFGRQTHLTALERLVGPSTAGVFERCDTNHDRLIPSREFVENKNPDCIGRVSDLCAVAGVCNREFPPPTAAPTAGPTV